MFSHVVTAYRFRTDATLWPVFFMRRRRGFPRDMMRLCVSAVIVCVPRVAVPGIGTTYTAVQKNGALFYASTSSNIDRFPNLFRRQNQENMCNNAVTKDPTTPQVCGYTTL